MLKATGGILHLQPYKINITTRNIRMIKKMIPLALMGAVLALNTACNAQNGFKKTSNGLEYKIVKDEKGTNAKVGDYMEFHIRYKLGDSVLFNSRELNNNQPVPLVVSAPQFKGDLPEGFTMLSEGDSAVFRVSVDSIMKNSDQPMPPQFQKGKDQKLQFEIKVVKVQDQNQRKQEMQSNAEKQRTTDDQLIQDYLKSNSITTAQKTQSGLYYNIVRRGNGPTPVPGDSVNINYTGMLLNGQKFDSNVDPQFQHVMPFWIVLQQTPLIPGWDEAIGLLPKGSKAMVYIPSGLAYGAQDRSPQIPANSVLVFDMEILDVKKGAAPQIQSLPQGHTEHDGHNH